MHPQVAQRVIGSALPVAWIMRWAHDVERWIVSEAAHHCGACEKQGSGCLTCRVEEPCPADSLFASETLTRPPTRSKMGDRLLRKQ